jgi:hypothetical protein
LKSKFQKREEGFRIYLQVKLKNENSKILFHHKNEKKKKKFHPSAKKPSIHLQVHETYERDGWLVPLTFSSAKKEE